MSSLLKVVLQAFETADGPLSLQELSAPLGIESGLLQEMVDFWVRQGRLRVVGATEGTVCSTTGCVACSPAGPISCPQVFNAPARYEAVRPQEPVH